jgi:hypothetical protein
MAKLTDEHLMDFVRFAKAKTYENTSALFASWREWVAEMYGDKVVTIKGRIYPPGTVPTEPFRGSILWEGDTIEEKRLIKRGGISAFWDAPTKLKCGHESIYDYCETCVSIKEFEEVCKRKGVTADDLRAKIKARQDEQESTKRVD